MSDLTKGSSLDRGRITNHRSRIPTPIIMTYSSAPKVCIVVAHTANARSSWDSLSDWS
jgi:hypothetical protein